MPATHVHPLPWTRPSAPGRLGALAAVARDEAVVVAGWLRRTRCRLSGHPMMLQFEPGRLSLRCHDCGAQTPGWEIGR